MSLNTRVAVVSLTSLGAAFGAYLYLRKKKEPIPETWEEVGKLSKLHLYPLKSGHRIELTEAECTKFGLSQINENNAVFQLRDRCLVIYGENNNEFKTARTYPKIMLVSVSIHDQQTLAINAPNMKTLYVKIPSRNEKKDLNIKLHQNEEIYSVDCGNEAAAWFSKYVLEKDSGLRLGFHDGNEERDITKIHKVYMDYYTNLSNSSTGLYSDLSAILLVNQNSVHDLNQRINSTGVVAENFRPNLVVDGPNLEPYEEHDWDWIKIGDVVLRNVKECTRCVMTTINPDNAQRNSNMEPLKTLKTYRLSKGPNALPVMGINCEVRKPGNFKLGDSILVSKNEKRR